MEIIAGKEYNSQIKALLASQKLPADDLPEKLDNFVVALEDDELVAVAGFEVYGAYGLLRSVAVDPGHRNRGIAGSLVKVIEASAIAKGLKELILLTETAPDYFARRGFVQINRDDIALEVKQSSEFSHVCPQSAIAMKKSLSS